MGLSILQPTDPAARRRLYWSRNQVTIWLPSNGHETGRRLLSAGIFSCGLADQNENNLNLLLQQQKIKISHWLQKIRILTWSSASFVSVAYYSI